MHKRPGLRRDYKSPSPVHQVAGLLYRHVYLLFMGFNTDGIVVLKHVGARSPF